VAEPTTPPTSGEEFVEARVIEVVSGDTIRVAIGEEPYVVRYIGINAPEGDSLDERLKQVAAEATAKNSELVAGQIVRLEKDVTDTDASGRLLRYVWVGDSMVNSELVRQGYAAAVTYEPDVKHQDLFTELQQQAKADGLGIWSSASQAVTSQAVASQAFAMVNANLRSGPGTDYEIVGGVVAGDPLEVVARNEAGDWYQLADGVWIFAELVGDAPEGLPVADVTAWQ
jgi:micrococcal nuclease